MNIKEIFYEIIKEASTNKVIISNEEFPIGFNTIIYKDNEKDINLYNESNNSTLIIKDIDIFINNLTKYINVELNKNRYIYNFIKSNNKDYIKGLISFLLVNMSLSDFNEPNLFINRYIDFLTDNTFNDLNTPKTISLKDTLFNCNLKISNNVQSTMMETPNKLDICFTKEINNKLIKYNLPTISYGISTNSLGNKECYIYSILNKEKKDYQDTTEERFKKHISRLLYKVNKNINKDEDIYNVSPSSIISLSIFISLLKTKGINTIKVVPYLPIRYLSRDLSSNNSNELIERNNFIQNNATNKFINSFLRLTSHFNNINIISYPLEQDDFLTLNISNNNSKSNNDLINNITNKLSK